MSQRFWRGKKHTATVRLITSVGLVSLLPTACCHAANLFHISASWNANNYCLKLLKLGSDFWHNSNKMWELEMGTVGVKACPEHDHVEVRPGSWHARLPGSQPSVSWWRHHDTEDWSPETEHSKNTCSGAPDPPLPTASCLFVAVGAADTGRGGQRAGLTLKPSVT